MGLAGALAVLGANVIGCSRLVTLSEDCASITVEATSDDANNTHSEFNANQCDHEFREGDSENTVILVIDILDRDADSAIPRVEIMLSIDTEELPVGQTFVLSREDEVALAPAIYQELDPQKLDELAGVPNANFGPFWSSNSGTISFAQQEDGSTLGDFSFGADNPSSVNNTALGGAASRRQRDTAQPTESGHALWEGCRTDGHGGAGRPGSGQLPAAAAK